MKYNYSFGRKILTIFQFGAWLLLAAGVLLLLFALGSYKEFFFLAIAAIISSLSGILSCIIGNAIIHIAETNQDIADVNKKLLKGLNDYQVGGSGPNSESSNPKFKRMSPKPLQEYRGHDIYADRGMYKVEKEEFPTLDAAKKHIEALKTARAERVKEDRKVPYYLRGE
ncbi:MAG: hypothetical protein JKY41_01170 [Rhodobacteraceae bacterium]|nr:hypothetical protein [Paracoccaceae bacterium]